MLPAIILLLIYLCLLAFLLQGLVVSQPRQKTRQPSVSILLAARNEAAHLPACLEALVQQNYPHDKMEIIIADDRSSDATGAIIKEYAQRYPFIRALQITATPDWQSSKKNALHQAYLLAQGEILFFTDADCQPPSTWIADTLPLFTENIGLVAGFSPLRSNGTSAWNGFLYMESLVATLVAAGSIGLGGGVTCAGRNLAVRAQTMREIAGYTNLPDTLSGDDDFLLQQVARHPFWQCRYSFRSTTHVPAAGPDNLKQYFRQKSRHLSAGKHFSLLQQTGYALYYLANIGLWLAALLSFWINFTLILPLVCKITADWIILTVFSRKLHSRLKLRDFLFWEALFPLLHIIAAPKAFFSKILWKPEPVKNHA